MRVSTTIIGLDKMGARFKAMERAGDETMLLGLEKAAISVHREAIKGIQKVSSGKRAWRYNPKRQVTISRPGDPFNTDTGQGMGSVHWEIDKNKLEAAVGSNLAKLAFLEIGTSTMAARPWLRPAVNKVKQSIIKGFKFVEKALK